MDSSLEYKNCKNCKGLKYCSNGLKGFVYFPSVKDDDIEFSYIPCKYYKNYKTQNEYLDNIDLYEVPKKIKEARMKDIYIDDSSRIKIIKYLNCFYDNYPNDVKGLYLSGNFGSGKTYIIAALLNSLAKKGICSAIVYFPEFLRSLKSSFDNGSYSDRFDYIKKVPILLIDDIGAENVTAWGRDEVLGTILQYRMDNDLVTFFTSNLNIDELELHLSSTKEKVEKVKARRIIERIKYLTTQMVLDGIDRRSEKNQN